jgi:hypothetical protein
LKMTCSILFLASAIAMAEPVNISPDFPAPYFPAPQELGKDEADALVASLDKDISRTPDINLSLVSVQVPQNMVFSGAFVIRYSNPEIQKRIIDLYLKVCSFDEEQRKVFGEEGFDYLEMLATVAESTLSPRIYEPQIKPVSFSTGNLHEFYLASVNSSTTLDVFFAATVGASLGKRMHPCYLYASDDGAGVDNVTSACKTLSYMAALHPEVLQARSREVVTFIARNAAQYTLPSGDVPVWRHVWGWDCKTRSYALDALSVVAHWDDRAVVEFIGLSIPVYGPYPAGELEFARERDDLKHKAAQIMDRLMEEKKQSAAAPAAEQK